MGISNRKLHYNQSISHGYVTSITLSLPDEGFSSSTTGSVELAGWSVDTCCKSWGGSLSPMHTYVCHTYMTA